MNVNKLAHLYGNNTDRTKQASASQVQRKSSGQSDSSGLAVAGNDGVSVSSRARELSRIAENVNTVNEVREAKVASLHDQVRSDRYEPSSESLATVLLAKKYF